MSTQVFQWENENSLRSFPFMEDTCLVDDSGKRLPDGIISDISVYSQNRYGYGVSSKVRVSCVYLGKELVSVSLVDKNSGILSITLTKEDLEPWRPYMLTPLASGWAGYITFADFLWPDEPQTYYFSRWQDEDKEHGVPPPQTVLDPHSVFGVGGPRVEKFLDTTTNEEATGFVEFVFPNIISRSIQHMDGHNGYWVYLDLKSNESLIGPCDVLSAQHKISNVCGVPLVTSIAGVRPDSNGNIMLRFI